MVLSSVVVLSLIIISILLINKVIGVKLTKGILIVSSTLLFSLGVRFIIRYYNYTNDITEEIKNVENNIEVMEASIQSQVDAKEELENYLKEYDYSELEEKVVLLNKENSELNAAINEKETLLKEDNEKYSSISNEVNLLKQIKVIINDFPTYNQFPNYPNGCEIASLYLILNYYKVNVTMEELVNNLDKGNSPYIKDGKMMGADPEKEYIGDPRLTNGKGYGVYQKPIIKLANKYKSGMKDITGSSLTNVLKIVNKGSPVQVWVSVNIRNTSVCTSWETKEGKQVSWMCGLHSLVIIGFTHNQVITSDPYSGSIRYYGRSQFEKMYNQYGKRAIYYEK